MRHRRKKEMMVTEENSTNYSTRASTGNRFKQGASRNKRPQTSMAVGKTGITRENTEKHVKHSILPQSKTEV